MGCLRKKFMSIGEVIVLSDFRCLVKPADDQILSSALSSVEEKYIHPRFKIHIQFPLSFGVKNTCQ